jgi:hypothetical protein
MLSRSSPRQGSHRQGVERPLIGRIPSVDIVRDPSCPVLETRAALARAAARGSGELAARAVKRSKRQLWPICLRSNSRIKTRPYPFDSRTILLWEGTRLIYETISSLSWRAS